MASLRPEEFLPPQSLDVCVDRRMLLALHKMSMEPCIFEALNKVREQIMSGGVSIVTQKGHRPRHSATVDLRAHVTKLAGQIIPDMFRQGLCLLAPRKHDTLGEVFECLDACDFDISFTELRHRRKYSCLNRRTWKKARRDVVVVEYPPYRPDQAGMPRSPMCALLETYLIRRQLENTRLAFSLDHAADGVLIARRRAGNVDRIFEESYLRRTLPGGLGSKGVPTDRKQAPVPSWKDRDGPEAVAPEPQSAETPGFLPGLVCRTGQQNAEHLAELAFLEELYADKFCQLPVQHRRTTAVAGVCSARDNTALLYSREAVRPEQEISYEQWCSLVARVFSLPLGHADHRNRNSELVHSFKFNRNSFLHQTAQFREFLNELLADLEAASVRARASHYGLRTDNDKQLLKCWWRAEILDAPDLGSVEELLQLIKLQNALRPELGHEAALLRALYEKYIPDQPAAAGREDRPAKRRRRVN